MKPILHGLLILLAATMVAGGIFLVVGSEPTAPSRQGDRSVQTRAARRGNESVAAGPGSTEDRDARGGESRRRGHHGHGDSSLVRGLVGVFRSVVVIALITLVATRTPVRRLLGLS